MCPGHQEQANGIMIVYVHTVIFYPGLDTAAGFRPSAETVVGRTVTMDGCKKWFRGSVR